MRSRSYKVLRKEDIGVDRSSFEYHDEYIGPFCVP